MSTSSSSTPHSRPIPIAPAPNGNAQQDSTNSQSTMPYTCKTCASRKVKCDKLAPVCSTCRKARLDCHYEEPPPRKRKRKTTDETNERLEQYEKLLKANGLLPKKESTNTTPIEREPAFWISNGKPPDAISGAKLVGPPGKGRYVGSNLWRHLDEELQPSSEDEEDAEEEITSTYQIYQSNSRLDPISAALLSPNSPAVSLLDQHPTYETAMKLWKLYERNVDPLVKVVHVPSGLVKLQRAAASPSSVPRPIEAVMFAVYHFALISISDAECQKEFGEPRAKLLSRYHDALRMALVNGGFLKTTDFALLQAFVLFLLSVRNIYDPHTFWILTGVAVRIAQRMGLHRDGDDLGGLTPYEVEMRRRVFWQLLPLDGLAAQLSGTGICIGPGDWTTKQPLNINDADIWPEMTERPEVRTGATDMIFCLARTEIAKFIQKMNPSHPNWAQTWEVEDVEEKERHLIALEADMEMKYLRYCDFANPVHQITSAMLRGAIMSGRLRIRLPRAKSQKDQLPDEERQKVWDIANKILDYTNAAHDNLVFKRFMWHMQAFFQFDPLIWILNELRRNPVGHKDEQIWPKIEKVFIEHPGLIELKRSLHVAVGRLTLKTWDEYHSRLGNNQTPLIEPQFIATLRSNAYKRKGSVASGGTNPTHEYNPFAPGDSSEDLPFPDYTGQAGAFNEFDFNQLMSFNGDSMDWTFWDQLVRDPTHFPSGIPLATPHINYQNPVV